jgi:hypothetical protein
MQKIGMPLPGIIFADQRKREIFSLTYIVNSFIYVHGVDT